MADSLTASPRWDPDDSRFYFNTVPAGGGDETIRSINVANPGLDASAPAHGCRVADVGVNHRLALGCIELVDGGGRGPALATVAPDGTDVRVLDDAYSCSAVTIECPGTSSSYSA